MHINEQQFERLKISREVFNTEVLKLDNLQSDTIELKDDEIFNQFIDKIEEFESKIEKEFGNILNQSTIATKSIKRFNIDEKFDFNIQKLNLLKSKSKENCNYQTMNSKINKLEKKIQKFDLQFKSQKAITVEKCERISDKLQDCLIVTNK